MFLRSRHIIIIILLLFLSGISHAQYGGGGSGGGGGGTTPSVTTALTTGQFEVYAVNKCATGEALDLTVTQDDNLEVTVLFPPGNYSPIDVSVVGTSLQLTDEISDEGVLQFDFPLNSIPSGTYELTVNGFVFFELTIREPDDSPYRVIYTNLLDGEAQLANTGIDGAGQALIEDNDMLNRMVVSTSDGEKYAYIADPVRRIERDGDINFGDCAENADTASADDGPSGIATFVERLDGTGTLLVMSDDDGSNVLVLRSDAEFSDPVWMPDDAHVVYVAKRNGITDLYMIDVETRVQTRITDNDDIELSPTVSPDGIDLVYTVDNEGVFELWTIAIEDGTPEPLFEDEFNNAFPAYSPDGNTIAFASDRGGDDNAGIYLYDVATGEISLLVDGDVDEIQPAWSPDGDLIIYSAYNTDNGTFDLYVIPLDESYEPINITDDPAWDDVRPQIIRLEE